MFGRFNRKSNAVAASWMDQIEPRVVLSSPPLPGPDSYGYSGQAYPFESINLPTDPLGNTQFLSPDIEDNTFNFYGTRYTGDDIRPSVAGIILFGNEGSRRVSGPLLGSPFQRAIAPLWDEWTTLGGARAQVVYSLENTTGDSTPDRLVVQWRVQDSTVPTGDRKFVQFQAILELNTGDRPGDIIFNYVSLDTGGSVRSNAADASVGIKDVGYNSSRVLISINDANNSLVGEGKAVRIHASSNGQPRARVGTFEIDEGTTPRRLQLDGRLSRDPDQSSASLQYDWDFDLDGNYGETGSDAEFGDETGAQPTYVRTVTNSNGGTLAFPIVLRVTDTDGQSSFDEGRVIVRNLPPGRPTIQGPSTSPAGAVVRFEFAAHDPSNSSPRFIVDWGEEQVFDGIDDVSAHAYYKPGTYTITVHAFDGDGNPDDISGPTSTSITITDRPDVLLNDAGVLVVTTAGGNDNITVHKSGSTVTLDRNGTISTYASNRVKRLHIVAGDGDDTVSHDLDVAATILGDGGDDSITGGSFVDRIDGGEGNNLIDAGDGSGLVFAGGGNNTITIEFGEIHAGDGDNHITSGPALVEAGDGNNTFNGTADGGSIVATFGDGDNAIPVSGTLQQTTNILTLGNGNNSFLGGTGKERVTAGTGSNTLSGGDGDDTLTVERAALLDGGNGNDVITVNDFLQTGGSIIGGAGNDIIHAASNPSHPAIVRGGDGDDSLFASDGADSIYGGAGRDRLYGGSGSDLLSGGSADDRLFGQAGKDRLYGQAGRDYLAGGTGDDRLFGGASADRLAGNEGDDELGGEGGNDFLRGDLGSDTMRGHAGDDRFFAVDGTEDQLFGDGGSDQGETDPSDILQSIESTN